MTFPVILLSVVLLNSAFFYIYTKITLKKSVDFSFLRNRALSFLFDTLVSCYTLLISGAISPFICLGQIDGSARMVKNPTSKCYVDGDWKDQLGTMVFFLIVYAFLLPMIFLFVLLWNRKQLNSEKVQLYLGSFVNHYKPQYFWWEVLFMVCRLLFVVISALIPEFPDDSAPYFGCFFLIFGFLSLEFFVHPFRRATAAKISAMWSLLAILVLMSDGLVFKSETSATLKTTYAYLMLFLILAGILTVLVSVFQKMRAAILASKLKLQEVTRSENLEISNRELLMNIAGELEDITNLSIKEIGSVIMVRGSRGLTSNSMKNVGVALSHHPSALSGGEMSFNGTMTGEFGVTGSTVIGPQITISSKGTQPISRQNSKSGDSFAF
jgi:hypothetical protein